MKIETIEHDDGRFPTHVCLHETGIIATQMPMGPQTMDVHYPLCGHVTETEIRVWTDEHEFQTCKVQPHTFRRRTFYE